MPMARTKTNEGGTKTAKTEARTLAIDVGGTGLKAAILDAAGQMATDRAHVETPDPCPPETLVAALVTLVKPLGTFDRVSVGFPGVVRSGSVVTAPHFGNEIWQGFPLAPTLSRRLGRPVRLLNDAEVQGLGVIAGRGLEVVLTLGTGVGSAVFHDGKLTPHLELAHHPIHKNKTYNEYLGNEARQSHGRKAWNRRVQRAIGIVHTLLNYDLLYIGGGNAAHISVELPDKVRITSNEAGITGGIRLWDDAVWTLTGTD